MSLSFSPVVEGPSLPRESKDHVFCFFIDFIVRAKDRPLPSTSVTPRYELERVEAETHLLEAAGGSQSRAVASGGCGPLSKVRVVAHGGESEQPEQGSRSESPPRETQSLHQLILNEDT